LDKTSDQKKSGLKLPTKFDKSNASPTLFHGGASNQKSSGNKSTTKLTAGKSSNKKQEQFM